MACTVRFKAHGKWVSFTARASKAASCAKPTKRRKGTWPKGKVPKHLKKYLFR